MKYILFLLILLQPVSAFAKEDCSLKGVELDGSSPIAQKLFYTGTCHYRNEDYALSASVWKELAQLTSVKPEYKELQISVLNNLGYLMFFGYGVEANQQEALQYWQQAIAMGHTESEYHLCHAYADNEQPAYDVQKAKAHCKKALLIYKGMADPNHQILNQLEKYNSQVNG